MRNTIVIAGLGLAAIAGLTACGTSEPATPATSIEYSGTYKAGVDIAPGLWKISGQGNHGTVAEPCKWSLWLNDNMIVSSATMAWGDWKPINEGVELITNHCGKWEHTTPEQQAERAEVMAHAGVKS